MRSDRHTRQRVEREDQRHAEEAPLLAQRRENQIGVRRRHQLRIAPARCPCPTAAGGEGPQRVRQLIAAVHRVVPRREPHGDALAHGVRDADHVARRRSPPTSSARPATGTNALPRAMPYSTRNRQANTSAGPMSFCRKKKTSESATHTSTGSVYSSGGMSKRA